MPMRNASIATWPWWVLLACGLLVWMLAQPHRVSEPSMSNPANDASSPQPGAPAADTAVQMRPPIQRATLAGQMGVPRATSRALIQERDARIAALEQRHRAEPRDAAWSTRAEQALVEIAASEDLADSNLAPDGYRADCRSETCRISATFASPSDAADWGTLFLTGAGTELTHATYTVVSTSGGAELLIYGTRR